MQTRSRSRPLAPVYLLFGACTSCYLLFLFLYEYSSWTRGRALDSERPTREPGLQSQRDLYSSRHLTTEQCEATFPHLTEDIETTVVLGVFDIHPSGTDGPLQVHIRDDELLIFLPNVSQPLPPELRDAQTATLHLLHRALLTSPSALPSTILTINVQDQPFGSAFSYTRPAFRPPPSSSSNGPSLTRAFLMPHFSFWSWPLPTIGSITRAAAAMDTIEAATPFSQKDPRLAWRGTLSWNSAHYPGQREELLRIAGGKDWADVQALTGYGREKVTNSTNDEEPDSKRRGGGNALMIEDFCRYKYVLYTEGITYSGRLQFLQHCNSVLLAPPVAWLQHTSHLIRPVWSMDLYPPARTRTTTTDGGEAWRPDEGMREAWQGYPAEEANAVFVAPDWSDLERTVKWLEDNPRVAEGIAARQRETFVGRGYLSPAAEACYWRALVRGWSEVVRYGEAEWEGRGAVSWETFSLARADAGG